RSERNPARLASRGGRADQRCFGRTAGPAIDAATEPRPEAVRSRHCARLVRRVLCDMVVMCGFLIELCLIFLVGRRYVVGWYAARVFFLISSTLVLAILLSETAFLYARLARSVMAESREREARLMTMDVLSASIAHEMNQPLASIVTNVDAAARWMGRPAPDLDEVKASLAQIRNSAYRARDLIGSIRAMVKRDGRNRTPLDLNE